MISINITGRVVNHNVVTTPCGNWLVMVMRDGSACTDKLQTPKRDSLHTTRIVIPLTIDEKICETCCQWNTELYTCMSLCRG